MSSRCWVYVLKSTLDCTHYYVGSTSDVTTRLAAHNAGACVHTRKYRPWQLHVRIEFPDEEHASAFERFLKSGSQGGRSQSDTRLSCQVCLSRDR